MIWKFPAFVCVDESKAVAAGSELLHAVLAGPVLVAAVEVRVEAGQSVGAGEVVNPLAGSGRQHRQQADQSDSNKQRVRLSKGHTTVILVGLKSQQQI